MLKELDEYRRAYDSLPYSGHQDMYRRIGEVYPEQSWWNAEDCTTFLWHYQPTHVVEVGGHDGGLARAILPLTFFVASWVNLELTDVPQVCDDPRYELRVPDVWAWDTEWGADALILSHVIEHLSETQLERLLANLDHRAVFVDAPLYETNRSAWMGTVTAHVLPYSMQELDGAFAAHGWKVSHSGFSTARGIESRTRWYERA